MSAYTFRSTQLKWGEVELSEQSTLAHECFDLFPEDDQVENDQIDEETLCQLVSYADNLSKKSTCATLRFFQLPNDATLHELCYKKHDSHSKNRITDICLVIFIIFLSLNIYFCTFLYSFSTLNFPPLFITNLLWKRVGNWVRKDGNSIFL